MVYGDAADAAPGNNLKTSTLSVGAGSSSGSGSGRGDGGALSPVWLVLLGLLLAGLKCQRAATAAPRPAT